MAEKRILHLTLHRKWFDAIRSGEKTVEYRANTPYYWSRLSGRTYDEIRFVNGYGKYRPFIRIEFAFASFGSHSQKWIIRLGKILEVGNV